MKNIPKKIYLNTGFDPNGDEDFKDLEEVTWSHDRTHETDIEYILATPALKSGKKARDKN